MQLPIGRCTCNICSRTALNSLRCKLGNKALNTMLVNCDYFFTASGGRSLHHKPALPTLQRDACFASRCCCRFILVMKLGTSLLMLGVKVHVAFSPACMWTAAILRQASNPCLWMIGVTW